MAEPLTITLDPPIPHDGGKIERLTVREPTVDEVIAAEDEGSKAAGISAFRAYQFALLTATSGLSAEALRKLPVTVYTDATDFLDTLRNSRDALRKPQHGETKVVTLPEAFVSAGVTYAELPLAEPVMGAVLFAEASMNGAVDAGAALRYERGLLSRVADAPLNVVGRLPITVHNEAADFLAGFTWRGPEAGAS